MKALGWILGAVLSAGIGVAADRVVEINPVHGLPVIERTDLELGEGATAFKVVRRWGGNGWTSTLDSRLAFDGDRALWLALDARVHVLTPQGDGWTSIHGDRIEVVRENGGYRLHEVEAGTTTWFDELGTPVLRQAPGLTLEFVAANYGFGAIVGPWGRVEIEQDELGRAKRVQAPGAVVSYERAADKLVGVRSSRLTERYAYEGDAIVQLGESTIGYDDQGRAVELRGGRVPQTVRYLEPQAGWQVHAEVTTGGELESLRLSDDGRLLVTKGPRGTTKTRFDNRSRLMQVESNGQLRLSFTRDRQDRVVVVQNARGITELSYTKDQRRPSKVTLPNGEEVRSIYDERGRLTLRQAGTGIERFTYDTWGRLGTRRSALGLVTRYARNAQGYVVSVEIDGDMTRFERTQSGQTTSITTPDGRVTRRSVEGRRLRVEDQRGLVRAEIRDAQDRLLAERNRSGQTRRYVYDDMGLLTRVFDGEGDLMVCTYTDEGRLQTLTDANGNTLRYSYPQPGVVRRQDPSCGTTTFHFDAHGQVRKEQRGEVTIGYRYDEQGRLIERQTPQGIDRLVYDASGRVIERSGADGSLTYTYTAAGKLASVTNVAMGETVRFTYDAEGRRSSMQLPWGTQSYERNRRGALTAVVAPNGERVEFDLLSDGRRAEVRYPNGVTTRFAYERELLTGIETTREGKQLDSRSYTYDAHGRVASCTTTAGTVSYGYDARGNLISAHGKTQLDYAFDGQGNRVADAVGGVQRDYELAAGNRVAAQGEDRFHYDARGALIKREGPNGTVDYSYDVDGHLRKVTRGDQVVRYGYAADGTRLWREDAQGRTSFLSDGSRILGERDASGWTTRYVQGEQFDDVLLAQRGDASFAYHYDQVRSITALTDGTGKLAAKYSYGPFGETLSAEGEAVSWNRMRFTSREFDAETGLYDFRARAYDPSQGRFTSADPSGRAGGMNLYAYVENDPLRYNDPLGLSGNAPTGAPTFGSMMGALWDRMVDAADEAAAAVLPESGVQVYHFVKGVGAFVGDIILDGAYALNPANWGEILAAIEEAWNNPDFFKEFSQFIVEQGEQELKELLEAMENDPKLAAEKLGYATAAGASIATGIVGGVRTLIKLPKLLKQFKDFKLNKKALAAAAAAVGNRTKEARDGIEDYLDFTKKTNNNGNNGNNGNKGPEGGCFLAGTLVSTADGMVAIEEIGVGDLVLSRNDQTGVLGHRPVVRLFRGSTQNVVTLAVSATEGSASTLRCTPEHPFFVIGTGWVTAGQLLPGDRLVSGEDQELQVTEHTIATEHADHYNFEVAEWHTYFVTGEEASDSIWVHNNCGKAPPGGRGFSTKGKDRVRFDNDDPTGTGGLKGHAAKHGDMGPEAYYKQVVDNMNTGHKFRGRFKDPKDGRIKDYDYYVTRTGPDEFLVTVTTQTGKPLVKTHHLKNLKSLEKSGITLPKGF